jgi:hypothetical protein
MEDYCKLHYLVLKIVLLKSRLLVKYLESVTTHRGRLYDLLVLHRQIIHIALGCGTCGNLQGQCLGATHDLSGESTR